MLKVVSLAKTGHILLTTSWLETAYFLPEVGGRFDGDLLSRLLVCEIAQLSLWLERLPGEPVLENTELACIAHLWLNLD